METTSNDYRISFFKPTTPIARHNRSIVIWLICIWAVAIFGFQILLRVIQKPTPEPAFTVYETVWPKIIDGNATTLELQQFAQSSLSVLAKNFITPEERAALQNGLSWAVMELTPQELKSELKTQISSFEELTESTASITDPLYVKTKNELGVVGSQIVALSAFDVRSKVMAIELKSGVMGDFSASSKSMVPDIMSKYLIHNQSFLTDFSFLGFPFHYFYTAIFLLILFVALCWIYCIRIDRRNRILGIED